MPYFEGADGTRLFYTDWGQGTPVVFVAGAWLSSSAWEFQMLPLSEAGMRCVAFDKRGHGRSDWVGHGFDYDTLADDLAALLDHLDLREVTLVAHSMGGGEVIRYLSRHGYGRVSRVVLVSSTAPLMIRTPDHPEGIEQSAFDALLAERTRDRPQWMAHNAQAFFATHLGNRVSSELVQWTVQRCLDCSAKAAVEVIRTGCCTDLREEAGTLRVPVLIVHGDADASAPVELCGRQLAKLVPGGIYKEYPQAGHGLFMTHAEQLNDDLLDFIGTAAR
ncbi:alpha/beta fold hydrolase [Streptomyces sp. SID486]|uniref:alpha/beta fold hydrolase n=1 Tax=unclassified Streptomyces TaxID=2593676 RepID=UPI00137212F9|nr:MULTISPECIES: alpha/beta hydrolase [unclassified Streptomyces]MYW15647.1 alpha/beta fold hydrolase [Streptomyces sp. SID2955]MYW45308.1 alpha/beta fold hydrolase [Streptomyces sp. SID161]MYX95785.1 alpha/beta fold hydrolase [Streptomyces sp. SID486]